VNIKKEKDTREGRERERETEGRREGGRETRMKREKEGKSERESH